MKMTSKEAIKTIKQIGDYLAQSNAFDIKDKLYECCETINQDLEVLDLLKGFLYYSDLEEFKAFMIDHKDKVELVKGWLKNDKQRSVRRLQGVKDEDFERVAKNQSENSLYHLAGDSIVVDVLRAIFREML